MIHIYRADTELGVALFNETNKFLYGEICSPQRLIKFVNDFPEHDVTVFIERQFKDDLQELYYLLPQLQDACTVKTLRKVNPRDLLKKNAQVKPKLKPTLICVCMGVMLGCTLLIPKSLEYRDSVLVKAQTVEGFTEEFAENQPKAEDVQKLYTSLSGLLAKVNVESITYSTGNFKVVFSSINEELQSTDFDGLDKATLTQVATLEDGQQGTIYIYELEGSL